MLSLLLPTVNRTCGLRVEHWESHADVHNCSLGGLQIKAFLDGENLMEVLTRAAVFLRDWRAELTFEEGTEILVATIEARTQWATRGCDPAYAVHLTTTMLTRSLQ